MTESGWGGNEPRWAEPGWDAYPNPSMPPGAARDPVPRAGRIGPVPRAVVVTGAVGGAGATTLAVLLGAALAEEKQRRVLVVDATPAGGDMAARVYNTMQTGLSWDAWARAGAQTAVLTRQLGPNGIGAVILGVQPPVPDVGALLARVVESVTADGWIVVIDAGSGAVASPALAAAVEADAAMVIALPQRAEGANRSRWFLSGMAQRYARDVVADAVVAMNDLDGGQPLLFNTVSEGLTGKVGAMIRIPTDSSLALGLGIAPHEIAPATRVALSSLIAMLGATGTASRKPAVPDTF